MKYHCPVCGAKLYNNQVCPYCKDVTLERITGSSNQKAKQAIREGNRDGVVYSNYIPADVNKRKLWLLTALLGWFGVHNFYVGKNMKGWFHVGSMAGAFLFVALNLASERLGWGAESGLRLIINFFAFFAAIAFVLYISDLFALLFRGFKVPVVLAPSAVQTVKIRKKAK